MGGGLEHVQRLVDIGVDSLKIEGRTKSPYYVARAAQGYRRAIDDAVAGRPFDTRLLGELEGLASRGVVTGCGGGNYCPTATVTREQMSVFLAVTFGLVLYGL